jgi:hypothetical protein
MLQAEVERLSRMVESLSRTIERMSSGEHMSRTRIVPDTLSDQQRAVAARAYEANRKRDYRERKRKALENALTPLEGVKPASGPSV